MSTFLGSGLKTAAERRLALDEGRTFDRLQFVVFGDAGWIKVVDPIGVEDSYTLTSAGAGLRLALSKYSQIRFDWGVPVSGREEIAAASEEDIRAAGRYYFSAQIQF
jgi:hemolysin activation/secretion protein